MIKRILQGLSVVIISLVMLSCGGGSDDDSGGDTTGGDTTGGDTTGGDTTGGDTTGGDTTGGDTTGGDTTGGDTTGGDTTGGDTTGGDTTGGDTTGGDTTGGDTTGGDTTGGDTTGGDTTGGDTTGGDTTGGMMNAGLCDAAVQDDAVSRAGADVCTFMGLLVIQNAPGTSNLLGTALVVNNTGTIFASAQALADAYASFPANQCDRYTQLPSSLNEVSLNDVGGQIQSGGSVSVGGPLVIEDASANQIGVLSETTQSAGGLTVTTYQGTVVRGNVTQTLKVPGNPMLGIEAHDVVFAFAPELIMDTGSIQSVDQITQRRDWTVNYNEQELPSSTLTNAVQWITTVMQQDGATVSYNCRGADDGSETPVFDANPNDTDVITQHTSSREMTSLVQAGNVLWLVYTLDVIN